MLSETMSRHNGDVDAVIDALTIKVGCDILALIEGRVSTEVDARLSYDTQATIDKALEFMDAYQKAGIDSERVLIKMASTWQGIEAARYLETQNIHCNLTLLFGQHQAIACADAGVTLISPFVGRILDWQKRQQNRQQVPASDDMGVQSVKLIYQYYKQHGYATQVMGASFRSTEQILALAGCDLLTIAPDLIDELAQMDTIVERQLSPDMSLALEEMAKISLTHEAFSTAYQNDKVTQDLLPKGIDGFIGARDELAQALAAMR